MKVCAQIHPVLVRVLPRTVASADKLRVVGVTLGLTAGVFVLAACLTACGGSAAGNAASSGSSQSGNGAGSAGTANDMSDAPSSAATAPEDAGTADDASGGPTTDATSSVSTAPGTCPTPTVQIDFSPMYSAFIPASTAHTFQIPAVTDDGNSATWSVSDSTQVQLAAQTFGDLPGVMITVQGVGTGTTGQITIFATESDGSCGASTLTITSSTEQDWQVGSARYNDGVSLTVARPDGGPSDAGRLTRTVDAGSFYERDGGTACTNCHGATATSGPYRNVSHTPEQTGGFSDNDLIQIITKGEIPDGGYFDPSVVIASCDGGAACTQYAYDTWHGFHQWADITSDQYPGIVVYLRSLQPEQQNGSPAANFGGGGRGPRDGGAFRRDGGPGLRDAARD